MIKYSIIEAIKWYKHYAAGNNLTGSIEQTSRHKILVTLKKIGQIN